MPTLAAEIAALLLSFKGKHDGSSTVAVVQMSDAEPPIESPADGFAVDVHDKLVQVARKEMLL